MCNISKEVTLVAEITFISPEVGGRRTPPSKLGYRGQFFYNDRDCDAVHHFQVDEKVPFGTKILDYVFLVNPYHHPRVREGMVCLIREGPHTIGYGIIKEVMPIPTEDAPE